MHALSYLPLIVGANKSRPVPSTFSSCTLFHILDRTHAKVEWTVSKANEVLRKHGKYMYPQQVKNANKGVQPRVQPRVMCKFLLDKQTF